MKGKIAKDNTIRFMFYLPKTDAYELDTIAILWGLDRADIVRIAVKKFLQDPTVDFILDAKEKKEVLRVNKQR